MSSPLAIDVRELDRMRKSAAPPVVLDVREAWERDICALTDTVHIPLASVDSRAGELPKDQPIVVMCHHGGRSARATAWLRQNGYDSINLEGGIDAWAHEIDPSMAKY